MKKNTESLKFQFTEDYKKLIKNSSIVKDFDKLIELAINKRLELSKNDILTNLSCKLVNNSIIRKIPMLMKRPTIKSYSNVLTLFILYRLSGLSNVEIKGKKRLLSVNFELLEQWKQFTDVDKYFYLLSLFFTNFSYEAIKERDCVLEIDNALSKLAETKKVWIAEDYEKKIFFKMYKYKTVLMAIDMFGLIDINDAPPIAKEGWNIVSIKLKSFMNDIWNVIRLLIIDCHYPNNDDDDEQDDFFAFFDDNIDKLDSLYRFADKITELIPSFTKRLIISIENTSGNFYFKSKLGKALRTIKIDYRLSLDDLCIAVLNAFDFDCDHLYDVKFISKFGHPLTFSGAPVISYAESPTTEDVSIGLLPIQINSEMIFTFDYGDNWEFKITLEKIEPIKNETDKIPDPELINKKGKAPEQYPDWE